MKAQPEDQALLLDLQELDTRLHQLEHRRATLPELAALAELAAEREELHRAELDRRGAVEDATAELRRVESDVQIVAARIERDRGRLQTTSSTKDVQALEQELAALAQRTSDLEDIQLELMEQLEEREAAAAATRDAVAALDARAAELTAARDAAFAALDQERQHASANRATIAAKVPAELLALYEKQRERYGIGASLLRGEVTSATGVTLTASDLRTVRAAAPDDVLLCPDSSAILVRRADVTA